MPYVLSLLLTCDFIKILPCCFGSTVSVLKATTLASNPGALALDPGTSASGTSNPGTLASGYTVLVTTQLVMNHKWFL